MKPAIERDLSMFPGGDFVSKGLADLALDLQTEEAWLVLIARPRLLALGIEVPSTNEPHTNLELYALIENRCPLGAHAAYNALIQRIVSFANAYELKN